MKTIGIVNKTFIYSLIFFLFLLSTNPIFDSNTFLGIYGLILLALLFLEYSRSQILLWGSVIGMLALISLFINEFIDVLRSTIYYVYALIVMIVVSNSCSRNKSNTISFQDFINFIIIYGLFNILLYLSNSFFNETYNALLATDALERERIGAQLYIVFFACLFLRFSKLTKKPMQNRLITLIIVATIIITITNLSRTSIMQFILASMLCLIILRPFWFFITIPILFPLAFFSLLIFNPLLIDRFYEIYLNIFSVSLDNFTYIDTVREKFSAWRSYENIIIIQKIQENFSKLYFFGCGLGCSIALDTPIILKEVEFSQISKFHNAFLTTFLHLGILAAFFYVYFISRIVHFFKLGYSELRHNHEKCLVYFIIFLSLFFLFLNIFFTSGIFNPLQVIGLLPIILLSKIALSSLNNNETVNNYN